MKRILVLIDGEHHPPAVRAVIDDMRASGDDVVGAVFCGGAEKVDPNALDEAYGVDVISGESVGDALRRSLERWTPEEILDLTDEPILMPDERFRLASIALAFGARYRGADFSLEPPIFESVLTKPSVRVFATGKRTGKTAVASALARHAKRSGLDPVIVAVGRGGPQPPEVIEAGTRFDARRLIALADSGKHAASDYVEDAITSGVTTIGCRRVGGGLAGATFASNTVAGAVMAQERNENFVILEGSGSSFPDVAAGAGLICVPADGGPELVGGYLNPYRLLLADVAVVTMAEEGSPAAATEAAIREVAGDLHVIRVVFRPQPLSQVSDRKVFFCSTAHPSAGRLLERHLEEVHGCEVVGMTHLLADRSSLRSELEAAPAFDVLLTEVKAAGIDVAARFALDHDKEVAFVNNELVGDGVQEAFDLLIRKAKKHG